MKRIKRKERNALLRKMITILQLVTFLGFMAALLLNKMLPMKYLAAIAGVLFVLWIICFAMQFIKNRVHLLGVFLSILLSVSQFAGVFYIAKANELMNNVGGAALKIDNMIVVVKADDPAETIQDAANYSFGVQYAVDAGNTKRMVEEIGTILAHGLIPIEYEGVQQEAQALLDGEVQAIIYNEAYTSIIEDSIDDYSSQVKVIYQYGIETAIEKEEVDISNAFNIYISGIDVEGSISKSSRSDVNIIMTVNPDTKQILLTSTPRDFYVEIPGVSGGAKDKLTHAGVYGVDASMRTLEQLYGIDISYYARVNFTSVINIVDALGGIEVESEHSFTAKSGHSFSAGTNYLNGEQALAFARERKSFSAGDRQRGKNQEAVIEAVIKKAMSPAILQNANQIIASLSDCVETNMSSSEMAKFINMQLEDPAVWEIESQAADGRGTSASCYSAGSQKLYVMIPDETVVAECSQKMQEILNPETASESVGTTGGADISQSIEIIE